MTSSINTRLTQTSYYFYARQRMLKHILTTCLAGLCISIAAQAQEPTMLLLDQPIDFRHALAAPAKSNSLEGTKIWGYYTDKTYNSSVTSIGFGSAMDIAAAMKVPNSEALSGTVIQGINFPCYDKSVITKMTVYVLDSDHRTIITSKDVEPSTLTTRAFCPIPFDDPVLIDRDLYVACSMNTTGTSNPARYPFLVDNNRSHPAGAFLLGTQIGALTDYTASYGAFICQVFISDLELKDADAYFQDELKGYTVAGNVYPLDITLVCNNAEPVTSIDYDIEVAGIKESRYAEVHVDAGMNKRVKVPVTITAPNTSGDYEVSLRVTKVNGINNSQIDRVFTTTFHNISHGVTRRVVMEENTGTTCGWCPRGMVGMENAREAYPDIFVGIALHQFNQDDPMYFPNYARLGFSSAPSCSLNRSYICDPYNGREGNILQDIAILAKEFATIGVEATASYTADTDLSSSNPTDIKVEIQAELDAVVGGDYEVVYVLTADGLYHPGWTQYNAYAANFDAADLADDIAKFGRGGESGKHPVAVPFNDVAFASSYTSATANEGGIYTLATDDKKSLSFTLSFPTGKNELFSILKRHTDEIFANVLILNLDGTVANGVRVPVTQCDGIVSPTVSPQVTQPVHFSLDGRRLTDPTSGVTILRSIDGTTRKVVK